MSGRIARPVHDVFEAVADPDQLSGYFTTNGAKGRLETGATVIWDFADFPGRSPCTSSRSSRTAGSSLRWQAADDGGDDPYETTVTMDFEQLDDGRTLVTIAEEGWRDTAAAQEASYGNCEGWTGMLCAMKLWVEHGIKLRDGFYALTPGFRAAPAG